MKGVWYHATNRGIGRESLFESETDHVRFLEYLGEMPKRYGFKIHGYVLMGNHYHLLIEDPEMLLSEGMKWLNVNYGMSFNRRRGRVGPVFQGRFKAAILDPEERGLSVSRYVHLNPVRVKRLGLNKREVLAIRKGKRSEPERIRERLKGLYHYRWSSYLAYVGREKKPEWLTTEFVLKKGGGRESYRKSVEKEVREGREESPWEELKGGMVLGKELWEKFKKRVSGNREEQGALRATEAGLSWEEGVRRIEKEKGESWEKFRDRYGDWGRNLLFLLMQERGRMGLREIGERSGGVKERSVWAGIKRIRQKLGSDQELKRAYERLNK